VDFSRETNGELMLVLTLRVDVPPTAPVEFAVACGTDCAATVPVGNSLTQLPRNSWQRLAVPLKCLADGGAEMGKLTTGASLRTPGRLELAISRIALSMDADRKADCTT